VIALRKLDGSTMYLNEDLVERVEGGGNSAVHLINGNYFVVRDDAEDINAQIRSEKQAVLAGAMAMAMAPDDVPVALLRTAPALVNGDGGR